jgi:3-isopropylmalate/(R)-2-methylmalate dehydratase small subunit
MQPLTRLDAVAVPLARANIDTDQIVPALYLQKPRSCDFGAFLFRDVRHDAHGVRRADFALNQPAYAGAGILVAGRNFGCGSSREHAVWALVDGGFRVVIAPSFGDIFHSNAIKNGLLPLRLANGMVDMLIEALQRTPGARMQVDLIAQTVTAPDGVTVAFEIDPFARHCLLEGLDELDYTLGQAACIDAFERRRDAPVLPS